MTHPFTRQNDSAADTDLSCAEPGHPERSILLYRMKSTDPGIAMPEVGRATVHVEGFALLDQWIKEMNPR